MIDGVASFDHGSRDSRRCYAVEAEVSIRLIYQICILIQDLLLRTPASTRFIIRRPLRVA